MEKKIILDENGVEIRTFDGIKLSHCSSLVIPTCYSATETPVGQLLTEVGQLTTGRCRTSPLIQNQLTTHF
jgi:hypothetical protein